jgi:hypothetical protein
MELPSRENTRIAILAPLRSRSAAPPTGRAAQGLRALRYIRADLRKS